MMMPRLGSIGATEMRLSSALAEYWSCLYHCSHRKRENSRPKQITVNRAAAATRMRKRPISSSTLRISVMVLRGAC
ncbi:hypothetical protein D9M72_500880 [compost metagenome]